MGKKASVPAEQLLLLPAHPSRPHIPIVDSHTHLVSTFSSYRSKYKTGKYETLYEFVRALYRDHNVEAIVDVWCEAPVQTVWKAIADSALTEQERRDTWGGLEYYFVMGVHPSTRGEPAVENDILAAMAHPRCRVVFTRQLQHAVRLGKPLAIHTREAEQDTGRIMKEHVPKEHKPLARSTSTVCYTDSPEWAARMLAHFPHLFIGITGVITYATNLNTSAVVREMSAQHPPALRILLETDAPFMVPSNLYGSLTDVKGRLPLYHSAMVPWTAEFVAGVASEAGADSGRWTTESVLWDARENARHMYGV